MRTVTPAFLTPLILGTLGVGCSSEPPSPENPPDAASLHYPVAPPLEESFGGSPSANPWLVGIPGAHPQKDEIAGTGAAESGTGGVGATDGEGVATGGTPEEPVREPPHVFLLGYEETSGAHKYLTLENAGPGASMADECRVLVFSNGGTTHGRTVLLPPMEPGTRLLVCTSGAPASGCGASMGSAPFNGDDALVVRCGDEDTDAFGRVGEDPGDAWTGGGLSTKDAALIRCRRSAREPGALFAVEAEWGPWPSGMSLESALGMCPALGAGGAPA